MMKQGDLITFVIKNNQIVTGFLRREEKLLDYYLIEGLDGKRYLIKEEEIINEKVHHEAQKVQETTERRKRGRPRKLAN